MATLRTRDVGAALVAKGAEIDDTHHEMYRRFIGGKLAAVTRISRGEREVGPPRIALMARQCKLTTMQFVGLVECSFSAADWDAALARVAR